MVSNTQIVESRKRENYSWVKVINYDSTCSAIDYTDFHGFHGTKTKDVHHLMPNKQLIRTDYYKGDSLVKRVTYFELSEQEIDSMLVIKSPRKDPIEQVLMRVYLLDFQLPVYKQEEWKNNGYKLNLFDRQGNLIKVE